MEELTSEQIKQLVMIRYWFVQGNEQVDAPHGLDSLAILQFHDAVEWFLLLAAETWHVDGVKKNSDFFHLWDAVASGLPPGSLEYREAMKKLVETRNSLKHRGLIPRNETVAELSRMVGRFFESATPKVFSLAFSSLSLTSLVSSGAVKDHLERAQSAATQDDYAAAMGQLAFAFNRSGRPSEMRTKIEAGIRGVDELSNRVTRLEGIVDALLTGMPPREFLHFIQLLPAVVSPLSGEPILITEKDYQPPAETYRYCERFLLDYVLRLQSQPDSLPGTPTQPRIAWPQS